MNYDLDISNVTKKKISRLLGDFYGKNLVNGDELSFTNYYMQINGQPFIGISGECHYSRVHESQWKDTIVKMKMGGLNIVSTYVFWIHHEEEEGQFCFDGNRNLRKFLELCKKQGMYVILRIGPFFHGEVRNGGLPDWLYGKPFEVRSLDERFLDYTRRLYHEIAGQTEGLYFQDGGPIIGVQIENEYMHSAAPWEMTTGITNEWVPGGRDGVEYMNVLKKIACEEGICPPFYTCTGWGGAATPVEKMLPVWGGYAFWPWIFYDYRGEHPATLEYIYRDNHNNKIPKTYNFEPTYEPESRPYACCEIGGGMSCYYHYRFQFPYESIDAMANVKLAGGCNFLGYYMYRGGSNPRGKKTPFLNEWQCPKISYDYQAVIGEYGQLRPSYYRLKALHLFLKNYQNEFCGLKTVLPEESQKIIPEDVETLRYAVRTDGKKGFLFLNNYQDHVTCREKKGESIMLKLVNGELNVSDISLEAGEEAVLPFGIDIEGYRLLYAKVQPLSVIKEQNHTVCFFFVPGGMKPEYVWDGADIAAVDETSVAQERVIIRPKSGEISSYTLSGKYGEITVVTLTREQSLHFYEIEVKGEKTAVLCDAPFIYDGDRIYVEHLSDEKETIELLMYPAHTITLVNGAEKTEIIKRGIWSGIKIQWPKENGMVCFLDSRKCGVGRYVIQIPEEWNALEECKDIILQITYEGDIGHLFINGQLLSDNFWNGAVWEIGLKEIWDISMGNEMTILITPRKENAEVNVSSTMAGRLEQLSNAVEELKSVRMKVILESVFEVNKCWKQ